MLIRYESEHELSGNNAIRCERCNRLGAHTLYSHIEKYANFALFQFPRFNFIKGESPNEVKVVKNNKSVYLPYNITLNDKNYTLACTIHHSGSYKSGHYYVVIATSGGFMKINNEIIISMKNFSPTTICGCLYILREE